MFNEISLSTKKKKKKYKGRIVKEEYNFVMPFLAEALEMKSFCFYAW